MPEADIITGCELYLDSVMDLSQLFFDYFGTSVAKKQTFLPWRGTTNQTFRNYGYYHTVEGVQVGAPISACFEMSSYCKTYSESLVQWNEATLIIGNSILNAVTRNFLRRVGGLDD